MKTAFRLAYSARRLGDQKPSENEALNWAAMYAATSRNFYRGQQTWPFASLADRLASWQALRHNQQAHLRTPMA